MSAGAFIVTAYHYMKSVKKRQEQADSVTFPEQNHQAADKLTEAVYPKYTFWSRVWLPITLTVIIVLIFIIIALFL